MSQLNHRGQLTEQQTRVLVTNSVFPETYKLNIHLDPPTIHQGV